MDFDLTQVSLTSIITVVGSTGVLSAICTHSLGMFRDYLKDRKAKKSAASYAALRLAVTMEAYTLSCAKRASDIQNNHCSGGHAGTRHYSLPELKAYPDDIDWKALGPTCSDQLLSFPNGIAHWNTVIHTANEHGGFPDEDGSFECDGYCALQGLKAWNIAVSLRKKFDLAPVAFPDGMWDIVKYLKHSEAQFHKSEQAKRDEAVRVYEELSKLPQEKTDESI